METKNRLRFVTATSLFDGHDVSINIMRRMLQAEGVEVIHLGHNRSASEVVNAVLMEDAHALALSSYQGGHLEYFSYVRELLNQAGGKKVKIFGGGGGVITPKEIRQLREKSQVRIYSPEDGMKMGLEGIIKDMIRESDYSVTDDYNYKSPTGFTPFYFAKVISFIEEKGQFPVDFKENQIPVLGITGTGGAGKSSLIDELLLRFRLKFPDKKAALVSVDPTRKSTQGALLGDRIRLGAAKYENFFVRSLATRDSGTELSPHIDKVVRFLKSGPFSLILVETSGIGQAADEITRIANKCLYVMTPEYGAATQLEKIEMLEKADFIALNKFEKPRAEDSLRDIRKQYRRNKKIFSTPPEDYELPIYGTCASRFNDAGVDSLFQDIIKELKLSESNVDSAQNKNKVTSKPKGLIAPDRSGYLRNISATLRRYRDQVEILAKKIKDYENLKGADSLIDSDSAIKTELRNQIQKIEGQLKEDSVLDKIAETEKRIAEYRSGETQFTVRNETLKTPTVFKSLSLDRVPRLGLPHYTSLADLFRFIAKENLPGYFPFTAGVFPFRRKDEEPKRQFAGEGGPLRTNKRFHYLSDNENAKRLSTAFDSVTLYGADPEERPDIFGKIGESGVSICTLSDMEDLYRGFDLTHPKTSVSMTINGPAPILLAMFMNTAIRQKLKGSDLDDHQKCLEVMRHVRGTVQADILKEDQAQNTCIFSLDFALRLMGDVQEYFSKNQIRNYYTVSVSGYHIAEAGANPITQLAFTLANGFTYVEYYISRGLKIDEFCENLSFFFSNGLDPEYTVIGRVARRIWAVVMRDLYGAKPKSQKFKYHIQTSGRSLHAGEIQFNDIRTTLQALIALADNCNSLHTNAFDEAITTPTEESVRRAMAIQLIINREFGLNQCDNPLQGSFWVDELTDLVEEAVLREFEKISDKGGVLGAMESNYQRGQIQEESLFYERKKDNGELPIIGINTFVADNISEQMNQEIDLTRASYDEKTEQIKRLNVFKTIHSEKSAGALEKLRKVAQSDANIFEELMETVKTCSLGQITEVLFEVGGQYRRNM
jgi:methylmalonyl-CoA mutase